MTDPKRVVYLIDSLTSGGAQRQLVELVKGLDKTRIVPSVVTYHDIPFFRKELTDAGIPVSCINKKDKIGLSFLNGFLDELRREKPDFIHSFLNVPNIYARIAKLLGDVKGVVTSERNVSINDRFGLKVGEKLTWRLSNAIIANAHAVKDILTARIGIDPSKIRVVHNGVDPVRFRKVNLKKMSEIRQKCQAFRQNSILIGLVGRIAPQKNHLGLVKAIRWLLNKNPNLDLRVGFWGKVTHQAYGQTLKRAVEELRLRERVFFLGAENDMASVYAACDAVVLPSLWEGFPNVALEAMSAGRPVIASAIVDNKKIVDDGIDGFLVEPGSVDNLASAIQKVIELPKSERIALSKRASEKVIKEYSIARMVENTMQVYREFELC
jgi:glycosyltransferase involved in cell wall biosynthesis